MCVRKYIALLFFLLAADLAYAGLPSFTCVSGTNVSGPSPGTLNGSHAPWNISQSSSNICIPANLGLIYAPSLDPTFYQLGYGNAYIYIDSGTTLTTLYSSATYTPANSPSGLQSVSLVPAPVFSQGFNGTTVFAINGNLIAGQASQPANPTAAASLPAVVTIGGSLGAGIYLHLFNNGTLAGTLTFPYGAGGSTDYAWINLFGTGSTSSSFCSANTSNVAICSAKIILPNVGIIGFYNTGTIQTTDPTNGITIANTSATATATINVGGTWGYSTQSGSNDASVTLYSNLNYVPNINVNTVSGGSSLIMAGNVANFGGKLSVAASSSFTLGTTSISSTMSGSGVFNNSGTITAANGNLNLTGLSNTNNGTIGTSSSKGTITFNGTTAPSSSNSGNLSNAGGTMTIASGATLSHGSAGTLSNTSAINVLGTWTIPPTISSNTGTVYVAGGTIYGTLSGGTGSGLNVGVTSGGSYVATNLTSSTASSTTFTLSGISNVTVSSQASSATYSTFQLNNSLSGFSGGTLTVSAGSVATFTANVSGTSAVNNSGIINIENGANFALSGNMTNASTGIINVIGTGTTSVTTYAFPSSSTISNVGIVNLYGTYATITGPLSGTTSGNYSGTLNIGSDSAATPNLYSTTSYSNNVAIAIPVINLNAGAFSAAYNVTNLSSFNIATGTSARVSAAVQGASSASSTVNVAGTLTWNPSGSFSNLEYIYLEPNSTAQFNITPGGSPTLTVPVTGCTNSLSNTSCTINLNQCCTTTGCSASSGLYSTSMQLGAATNLTLTQPVSYLTNLTLGYDNTNTTLQTQSSISNITNLTVPANNNLELIVNSTNPALYGVVCNVQNFSLNGTLTIGAGASFAMGGTITSSSAGTGAIVNNGQLTLNGTNLNSNLSFTNNSTGTFKIIGQPNLTFTGSTFINNGTIITNFNANNGLPSITITNAVPQLSNGTFNIAYANDYIATNTYPLITATSSAITAALNPGVAILPQPSFYISEWSFSSTYTAAGGAVIAVQVVRDGFDQHALTQQTKQIGAYLEEIGSSGTTNSSFLYLLNALNQIENNQELTLALQSLEPPQYTMLSTIQRLNSLFGNIEIRIANLQYGYGAGDELASIDNGFWVRPYYSNGTQLTTGTLIGYTDKTQGYLFGIDKSINNNFMLGIAGSIAKTTVVETDNLATNTLINSYDVNFYATYKTDSDFYVDGLISGGVSNYHALRTLSLPNLLQSYSANYSSQQITCKLFASKPIPYDMWQLTPRAVAQYTFIRQLPYTESGDGAYANVVEPKNINLFRMGVGTSLGIPMVGAGMISLPSVFGMMYVDVEGGADTVNTMFVIGGPVLTGTVQQSRIMISLGANYELQLNDNWQVAAGWAYDVRHKFKGQEAYLNLRYAF